jgi:hypothetical protein
MLARYAVLPPPPPTSGSRKLLFCKPSHPRNRLESTLLQVFILENLKLFGINTYEKQGEGCTLWLTNCYKKVSLAAVCPPAGQPSLFVAHFHFPIFRSFLPLCASARQPIFHSPYTLPSSVSCNSFVCHSYENTRGVGVTSFKPKGFSPLAVSGTCRRSDVTTCFIWARGGSLARTRRRHSRWLRRLRQKAVLRLAL